jgi:hypothetical protein
MVPIHAKSYNPAAVSYCWIILRIVKILILKSLVTCVLLTDWNPKFILYLQLGIPYDCIVDELCIAYRLDLGSLHILQRSIFCCINLGFTSIKKTGIYCK